MNLMALRPSQWDRLEVELANPSTQEEFLAGLQYYLSQAYDDNGADRDRIYVTAVNTENVNAWDRITTDRLVTVLKTVELQIAKMFASGLEAKRRESVISRLEPRDNVVERPRHQNKAKPKEEKKLGTVRSFILRTPEREPKFEPPSKREVELAAARRAAAIKRRQASKKFGKLVSKMTREERKAMLKQSTSAVVHSAKRAITTSKSEK
ncbi:hypothetical protein [Rhizobium leguminosarum]|uniref:hypothetical protein n=1 Tax=Rhizobium TaxID=379 RepID=UPI0013BB88AF|nr:hypothetical protein [Rhizobium leguminosarum]MBY5387687.1 hypothetical protein [Rhizobium leguminosarum]MBY5428283.1 hypothetical protein [Rhizobium leguminosarum]NEK45496.1 hypothetical protein [Rhizobium leguminosarum]